jgi:hypothetical protein
MVNQLAGQITIIKDAVPDDPQDFDFACSGLGTFSLDDDGTSSNPLNNSQHFPNVTPGNYNCVEAIEPGWTITISCSDPDGGTTTNSDTANIDLDAGEHVTCTFTNTFNPGPPAVGGIGGLLEAEEFVRPTESQPGGMPLVLLLVSVLCSIVALGVATGLRLAVARRSR